MSTAAVHYGYQGDDNANLCCIPRNPRCAVRMIGSNSIRVRLQPPISMDRYSKQICFALFKFQGLGKFAMIRSLVCALFS